MPVCKVPLELPVLRVRKVQLDPKAHKAQQETRALMALLALRGHKGLLAILARRAT